MSRMVHQELAATPRVAGYFYQIRLDRAIFCPLQIEPRGGPDLHLERLGRGQYSSTEAWGVACSVNSQGNFQYGIGRRLSIICQCVQPDRHPSEQE